ARLRGLIDASWDFDAAERQYLADKATSDAARIAFDGDWGNLYLMADGRLVAADTPLYTPVTLTEHPEELFADWPGEGG
ncbi:MAG: hypothetical protein HC802_07815, partial [Caldilineaceae bacterium]|nr:hypothetical protein [Caldilineaceae bacterium]